MSPHPFRQAMQQMFRFGVGRSPVGFRKKRSHPDLPARNQEACVRERHVSWLPAPTSPESARSSARGRDGSSAELYTSQAVHRHPTDGRAILLLYHCLPSSLSLSLLLFVMMRHSSHMPKVHVGVSAQGLQPARQLEDTSRWPNPRASKPRSET